MRNQIIVAAVAALVVAAPASAQGSAAFAARSFAAPTVTFDAARTERARQLLARAEQRWEAFDFKGARRDFAEAAGIMQSQRVYAGPTLLSLAQATYVTDTPESAARVLLDAATEADFFGDVQLQITALIDASQLFAEARDQAQAKAIAADAQRRLKASSLAPQVKQELERRIAGV
jgi:hypothetical protein